MPDAWEVCPMNRNEKPVAEELIPRLTGQGWLLGDAQYDSNRLCDLAFEHGHRLLAPRRKKRGLRTSLPPSPSSLRRAASGGGLSPLPSWVRRLHRVQLWIQANSSLNAQRIHQRRLAIA
jgi:hypothetical protein